MGSCSPDNWHPCSSFYNLHGMHCEDLQNIGSWIWRRWNFKCLHDKLPWNVEKLWRPCGWLADIILVQGSWIDLWKLNLGNLKVVLVTLLLLPNWKAVWRPTLPMPVENLILGIHWKDHYFFSSVKTFRLRMRLKACFESWLETSTLGRGWGSKCSQNPVIAKIWSSP